VNKISNLKPYFNAFAELFFPSLCKGCDNPLSDCDTTVCMECATNLPLTGFETWNENPVFQLFWGRVEVEFACSIYHFRKGELLQKLIYSMKYNGQKEIGLYLGSLAGQQLKKSPCYVKPDMILPVPLHPQKLKIRGFNQSELLARGLSQSLDVKVSNDLLYKSKATSSQTRKSHYERWLNVNGVFSLSIAESLQAAHVLLVDDLVTTGSTVEACCNTLLKVPGLKVSVLTIGYVAK